MRESATYLKAPDPDKLVKQRVFEAFQLPLQLYVYFIGWLSLSTLSL